ncbi:unnamed protein product [Protopolystoma xenopodis]|uniref:Uncharacterized protein n=1 Tax=Protopolystoma xenopodis TaxID=117903 RepID=A0A3S5B7P4_9PLAT|nr:unnamed protein product [Protopolystoma xenopodis]
MAPQPDLANRSRSDRALLLTIEGPPSQLAHQKPSIYVFYAVPLYYLFPSDVFVSNWPKRQAVPPFVEIH